MKYRIGLPQFGENRLMPQQELRTHDSRTMPHTSVSVSAENTARQLLDIMIAAGLLILAGPLLLIIAVAVKVSSPGPVFYRQTRVGRAGRLFEIWKFRTMTTDSERHGPAVTAADDGRVTPIGRCLRGWKMDELPQLWNVIKGEMSLVGPRPQVPRFVDCFGADMRGVVLHVRPGITGPTALHFRYEQTLLSDQPNREQFYIEQILPVKLEMDARYVQTRSLRGDLRILTETAWVFTLGPLAHVLHGSVSRRHHATVSPQNTDRTAR